MLGQRQYSDDKQEDLRTVFNGDRNGGPDENADHRFLSDHENEQTLDVDNVPGNDMTEPTTDIQPAIKTARSDAPGLPDLEAQGDIPSAVIADTGPAHTAFGKHQKRFIVLMVTLASFFSPLSGQIYYPVMPTLVKSYHLTTSLVNLTITTYMILQGLAPSFMGTFADAGGRRPAYIIAFAIYTAANIGLALQNSFAALLVLRCLQSAGSSGTVSFGYGVIADIATPAERGKYVGPMSAGVMVAPALGPVIGGLLAKFLGWRSVFWFLVIISGGYLIVFMIAMPETARNVVGNGSVQPKEWWRLSLIQYMSTQHLRRHSKSIKRDTSEEQSRPQLSHSTKLKFPNPLETFVILLEKDASIIIAYIGLVMFANIALLTSTANLFGPLYKFNELQIGLCFLPLGVSASIGAVLNGKLVDYNYKRTARILGFPVDRKKGDDLSNFPIERTRLQCFFPVMAVGIAAFIPYGWTLQSRTSLAAPLVLQFIIGFCFIASLNTLNTLLVDLFPERAATAAAACNLVRCWLGAVGAAVVDQMLTGMGCGWCFAFLGLCMAVTMSLLLAEYIYGMGWRQKRLDKIECKKRSKEAAPDAESTVDAKGDSNEQKKLCVVSGTTQREQGA
ncbi:hypothetical protein N7462_007533 [Penicillium macrosclerotiorum]|uniref:uncharacterized protein n=1 Tax=Penicillium macrosclerotiorum TaxID=303699 RepID=UPI002548657F|nr:uncharacterized protein N7462_007533 [Penicillium macrosclerotiorum]KAJ5679289.1 hypothetical protein N7462_007533 [Penicillium macrosclerotiorum]